MKREVLLDVAYYAMVNIELLDSYPFGVYNHLLNLLIYKGETYLNDEMICYGSIKKSFSHQCVNYYDEKEIDTKSPIFKECKELINFKESNIIQGKWIKITFNQEEYINNYLMNDIINQINKMEKTININISNIEKSEHILKEEKNKSEEYKEILNYLKDNNFREN